MKKISFYIISVFVLFLLLSCNCNNAYSQSNSDCRITITSPAMDGESVEEDGAINGKASIPHDYYLWVLVHRTLPYKKQDRWWPQGDSEISSEGKWDVWVTYGNPKDIGHEFEIAVIIVDRTEHLKLQAWIKTGDLNNPISMSKTICPPVIRVVKKTR